MSLIRTQVDQFSAWTVAVVAALVLGLMAPAVHPLMHQDAADTCAPEETAHHCDHSQHDAGIESYHASHDLDTCVLCSRQPVSDDFGPSALIGKLDVVQATGMSLTAVVGVSIRNLSHSRAPPVA